MHKSQIPGFRQRTLLLCTSYIVGASFNKGKLEWLKNQPLGSMFNCRAEPDNPWDANAIHFETIADDPVHAESIGFMAKAHNVLPAQLLAAGLPLCAVLVSNDSTANVNKRCICAVYLVLA